MRSVAFLGIGSVLLASACSSSDEKSSDGDVTIEFAQWWEPELPSGEFRALIDEFETQNPGIKVELISGPYASTKEQLFASAATGEMPDVVGLDGAWVSDFATQGAIADLTDLMASQGYDDAQIASQIQVDGATYMIPVVNFVYPLFTNDKLLQDAGVDAVPSTRSEFQDAAVKISALADTTYGWVAPLSLEAPNGVQNDIMSWLWASGGSMLANGQPDLTNTGVTATFEYIKGLWDAGVVAPGAFTMKEQDKVEEFTNERVGMMIDSLAHIQLIKESNPDLDFTISALPADDGYAGERGIPYASWGIGVADSSDNKEAAWKLVEFLMSADTNSELSSMARAFPGNTESVPDYLGEDELFQTAFEIYQSGFPANEFTGLPVSEQLMRLLDEQLQRYLNGEIDVTEALQTAQDAWAEKF
jgi:multiple sugar transport system substrate-binding protein